MAKLAKSKDTKNWRKGADLRVGDLVAVAWTDRTASEFSPIVAIEKVPTHYCGAGAGSEYLCTTEAGRTRQFAGREFAEGRY